MSPLNDTPQPLIGCIADDFTGATDLANMLVRNGMRTVQTIGVPASSGRIAADALVVAQKSRTIPAADAVAQSLRALAWLREQGCRQFLFKYCSTFDSTDAGNIGPVADALLDALAGEAGAGFTIACPAFPENGRTVYRGHLFVGDALLDESGMEKHPLTPMTDANLVRALQRQTRSKVGLIRYDAIAQGASAVRERIAALRAEGVRIAIADALCDADLGVLGEACADLPLVTGGSGIALGLSANFPRSGLLDAHADAARLPAIEGLAAVLAGSASNATNAQVAAWRDAGKPHFRIDPLAVARGKPVVDAALAFERQALCADAPQPVLIYATAKPDEVECVQQVLGAAPAGELVEATIASIACGLREIGVRKFVVAGGETSGAVVQALGVSALVIGPQIDPGVPATATIGTEPLGLALKSGNFGAVDFFDKALRRLEGADERPPCSLLVAASLGAPRRDEQPPGSLSLAAPHGGEASLGPVQAGGIRPSFDRRETKLREEICTVGASLYARGHAVGSAGNISARVDDGWLITPTDACLGRLDPAAIAKVDLAGNTVSGDRPSKTLALHRGIYANDATARGIVHTHSTHLVALTLHGVWREADVLPPITPYYVMKVGHVPLIRYRRPGDPEVADAVAALAASVRGVLLERLGPVVWAPSVSQASFVLEELEETARLWLMSDPKPEPLGQAALDDLRRAFNLRW